MNPRTILTALAAVGLAASLTACQKSTLKQPHQSDDAAPSAPSSPAQQHVDNQAPTTPATTEQASAAPRFDGHTTQFPRNTLSCDDSGLREVNEWLSRYFAWEQNGRRLPVDDLVAHDGKRLARSISQPAPVLVVLGTREAQVNGRTVADADVRPTITDMLERQRQHIKAMNREWTHPGIALAIHQDVPWRRVANFTDKLGDLAQQGLMLAFAAPLPPGLEPVPANFAGLFGAAPVHPNQTQPPPDRPSKSDTEWVAGCDQMSRFLSGLRNDTAAPRHDTLRTELSKVWRQCECKPDISWLVAKAVARPDRGVLAAVVNVQITATGAPIELDANTPWSEAADKVVAHADKPIKIAITAISPPSGP